MVQKAVARTKLGDVYGVWMRHTDNKHGIVKIYIAHEVENKTMRVVTCFLHDYMYFRFFLQASINFLVSR